MSKRINLYKNCLNCNDLFKTRPSVVAIGSGKYCSGSCAGKHLWSKKEHRDKMVSSHVGKKSNNALEVYYKNGGIVWNKGKKGITVAWNKGLKLPQFGGENHYAWVTDRTPAIEKHRLRGTNEWKIWRGDVFERDKYTCQECHAKGVFIEPHHIQPLRETLSRAFEVNNGITLCRPCHQKTIRKEEQFSEKYSQIIVNRVC